MSINSKKSNLMQVIAWMKSNKFMKEAPKRRENTRKTYKKKNFKK
jgi:hypothetical protein